MSRYYYKEYIKLRDFTLAKVNNLFKFLKSNTRQTLGETSGEVLESFQGTLDNCFVL